MLPDLIQGGMGIGVSGYKLARAVAENGALGIVSGTAIDAVCARRLQRGDPDGDLKRAFDSFPLAELAARVWRRYFVPDGLGVDQSFRSQAMVGLRPDAATIELLVLANYAEVWLAKEGHTGAVGVNYLTKIQAPCLPSIYGAMLAGVDVISMGAGIPQAIPAIIDALAEGLSVSTPLKLAKSRSPGFATPMLRFDPQRFWQQEPPKLAKPKFLPILASATLAARMASQAPGACHGFVIENEKAGGHSPLPRGWKPRSPTQKLAYGPRDEVDYQKLRDLGLPFWLAGSFGYSGGLHAAKAMGAAGIQVGTLFAFCAESGLRQDIKAKTIAAAARNELHVLADAQASPTGFPFKIAQLAGTLSDPAVFAKRPRRCDMGYLREAFIKQDGGLAWRCPGEPEANWLRKGGQPELAVGKKCLCNGLIAGIGLGQRRADGADEPALVTAGNDLEVLSKFLAAGVESFTAQAVMDFLRGKTALIQGAS